MIKIKKRLDNKIFIISVGVKKQLNQIKPDLVVAMEYNPTALQSLVWCKINKKPYITWTDGTLNSERNISFIGKILRRIVICNSAAYIASSTKSKELQLFYGADERKSYISLLSFDITKRLNVTREDKDGNDIIFVGSLIKRKGLDLLLKALKDVRVPYRLHVVGNGIEEKVYRDMCQDLRIQNRVIFHGFRPIEEVFALYKEASLFVLPSREDCFGLVVLEAMCTGLPIISSMYADSSFDLVSDGVNGYIIDPNDSELMRNKIEIILSDKKLRYEMGKKSIEKALTCSFDYTGAEFIRAIESIGSISCAK